MVTSECNRGGGGLLARIRDWFSQRDEVGAAGWGERAAVAASQRELEARLERLAAQVDVLGIRARGGLESTNDGNGNHDGGSRDDDRAN